MLNIFRVAAILSLAPMLSSLAQDAIDLNSGAVVVSQENVIHAKAAEMLRDEVSKRTGLRLPGAEAMPPSDVPAIVLGSENNPPSGQLLPPRGVSIPEKAEGYAIWVDRESRNAPTVFFDRAR